MTKAAAGQATTSRLIILGAGRPRDEGRPYGLQRVTPECRVLDWQLNAFASLAPTVEFVAGYDIEEVVREFPDLSYHFNPRWEETGSIESLAIALEYGLQEEEECDLYIVYSDILLRSAFVTALQNCEDDGIIVAFDSQSLSDFELDHQQRERFEHDGTVGEFVGLVRILKRHVGLFKNTVLSLRQNLTTINLSSVIREMRRVAPELLICGIEASGKWAHAEHSRSVARFILGSKAVTLKNLQGRLAKSIILPLSYFDYETWVADRSGVVQRVLKEMAPEKTLIVRSSAMDEDGFNVANAGRYHSELDVSASLDAVSAAIDKVFNSYGKPQPGDQVLVQPQLENVKASGVIFTRQLATGAPYYVLNYTEDGDTTAITSGAVAEGVKIFVLRNASLRHIAQLPGNARLLLEAAKEIETSVFHDALDIEFAIFDDNQVATLQCRPLMLDDDHQDREADAAVYDTIDQIEHSLESLSGPVPGILGRYTIWSVMADWNPAEIIGPTPGALALDIYRYIITDRTWAKQRSDVGYRDVTHWPLVRSFGGQAFVDVRCSVNSFLPASVPDKTAEKIINFGLERLKEDLTRHDKIEFDIVPTCLDFNFAIWTQRYMDAGALTAAETSDLEDGLRSVTRSTIARAQTDVEAAEDLERRCKGILDDAKLGDGDWVRFILDMCRDKGALNFAHLARAGFVAVAFLKSAVDQKFINEKRYNQLLNSVKTVGGLMQAEAWNVKTGKLDFAKFVERFGHIRPGTYDISAPSYKDRSDLYLAPMIEGAAEQAEGTFSWTEQEADAINEAFTGLDVGLNANTFLAFFHTAISGREYSKFVFTRLLSAVLDRIGGISRECGLSSEQSESLSLDGIIQGACNIWGRNAQIEILQDSSRRRIEQRKLASLVLLPPVFTQPQVVRGFVMPRSSANFVTRNKVIAPLVVVRTDSEPAAEKLEGKIAAIVNADPGYDYLFSVKIAGLITAFGGPNSHMAIRAAEFGLPAAIGVGEDAFMNFVDGLDTELDCHKKRCFQHLIV